MPLNPAMNDHVRGLFHPDAFGPPSEGYLLVNPQSGCVESMDSAAQKILENVNLSIKRNSIEEILPGFDSSQLIQSLDQNDKQAESFIAQSFTTSLPAGQGEEITLQIRAVPLLGSEHDFLLLAIQSLDAARSLGVSSDALTGLPDRRALGVYYQHWQHIGGETPSPLALLFMDLDQFKQVNDLHGHAVGDQVLLTLAKRWQRCLRDDDLVVRYGGDEFVVLLTSIENADQAAPVLSRLREVTSLPVEVAGLDLQVGVTIGTAFSKGKSPHLEDLLQDADRDMYAIKRSRS